jgi:hypothetical protein
MLAFCDGQQLSATGYFNNLNSGQIDLGGPNPVSAAGRTDFIWNIDLSQLDETTGDETYRIGLVASNDPTFTAGNVETLAVHDFGAAANRLFPAINGTSPAVPATGLAGTLIQLPATNLMQRIYYRYLRMYGLLGGTTPLITARSWISRAGIDV